jgi:7-cyano-7-deazaguanine synthase
MITLDGNAALVLFSGGQDSTVCIAWALTRFARVETVGFHYGQRHAIEMEQREPIREALRRAFPAWAPRLGADHVLPLDMLGRVSRSALTSDLPAQHRTEGLPATFVPGRNLVFFTFAAIAAYQRDIKNIVTGVCETDYSGYPDCRDDTVKAMQAAVNLGMESRIVFHTPLMWIDKAATWRLAEELGGPALVDIVRSETHSCYAGDRTHEHPWGFGCGACDACRLRAAGWDKFSLAREPTRMIR